MHTLTFISRKSRVESDDPGTSPHLKRQRELFSKLGVGGQREGFTHAIAPMRRAEDNFRHHPFFYFKTVCLVVHCVCTRPAGWWLSRDSPVSASHLTIDTTRITEVNSTASGFYMSLKVLNACPQACAATTEPFSSPSTTYLSL